MIQHTFGILTNPRATWRNIAALPDSTLKTLLLYPLLLALLPAVAWYFGTTQAGWSIAGGSGQPTRLTPDSARSIIVLFYLGMVACVMVIGYFVHWMAHTYGAQSSVAKGIVLAGLTATPLFISGLVGFYPLLWLDLLIGVAAVSWSVYLLYLGIPIVMDIPEERGFLFSSAVVAIALVILISLMVGSVFLWEFGATPTFTD
ncbi:MAG: Yip1 family protein [Parahaliea sp.]